MFIYGSLAFFVGNAYIYIMLLFIWSFIFTINIISKDIDSLAKK
jgi:hypothetical protein